LRKLHQKQDLGNPARKAGFRKEVFAKTLPKEVFAKTSPKAEFIKSNYKLNIN
jgi:hypothetical protein